MVRFLNLQAQTQAIRGEIEEALGRVLDSCRFVLGPEVEAFEKAWSELCGVKHSIALNSGTSALHLSLLAAGVGPGDEVITIPMTFVATVASICYTGARPVFVDIDAKTYTMDASLVEAAITEKTKALLPVHLYGQPADLSPLMEIAKKHDLVLIEDAAQAHASTYQGKPVGSIGDLGCFSFYPGKNLGAMGEGGMVTTSNDDFAKKVRMLRDWGQKAKYDHVVHAFNYRMSGFQGAVLGVKLKYLEEWTQTRRRRAALYGELLAGASEAFVIPYAAEDRRHVYHIYSLRVDDRQGLRKALDEQGIQSGLHYPSPVHLLGAYKSLGYKEGDFPESEAFAARQLSLPMCPYMSEEDVVKVAGCINKWAGSSKLES